MPIIESAKAIDGEWDLSKQTASFWAGPLPRRQRLGLGVEAISNGNSDTAYVSGLTPSTRELFDRRRSVASFENFAAVPKPILFA